MMIVSEIRQFMRERRRASLDEIAVHFDMDPSAIEGIMDTLAARGMIVPLGCGGCASGGGCAMSGPKVYGYIGDGTGRDAFRGASCTSP